MVICLERGADLHMAQRIPLPLTVSCFSKIQIGFIFLVPAHPGIVPDKRPLNRCVYYLIYKFTPLDVQVPKAKTEDETDSELAKSWKSMQPV